MLLSNTSFLGSREGMDIEGSSFLHGHLHHVKNHRAVLHPVPQGRLTFGNRYLAKSALRQPSEKEETGFGALAELGFLLQIGKPN